MTQLLNRLSMPLVAFCLLGILGEGTVTALSIGTLLTWVGISTGSLFVPGLRSSREVMDLTGALVLTALTGWTSSPFVTVLMLVVTISGVRHGSRRALFHAGLSAIILALISVLFPNDTGVSASWTQSTALSVAMLGLAWLGGRLKGRWHDLEEQHDQILKALEEGIVVTDPEGRIIEANPAARSYLGFPSTTPWVGIPIDQILRRDSDMGFRKALTTSAMVGDEIRWSNRDGVERSFRVRTTALESGVILAVFTDRTAERRVIETEARLTHLEELDELSLGLAHEIRNPLASLRGAAEEISGGKLDLDQAQKMSGIVNRESERLNRTVDRFLEYSANRKRNLSAVANASTGVADALEMIRQRTDCADLKIRSSMEPEVMVSMDGDSWNSVITNLVINAVEACLGNGVIEVSLASGNGVASLTVEDDGPGISSVALGKVFHPFFTTKSREGGLGLAIVRKIIEESGGRIELDSEEGVGTTFRVIVPLVECSTNEVVEAGQK